MRRSAGITVLTLALVLAGPAGAALASAALRDGVVVAGRSPQVYTFSARNPHWSIVVVQSAPTADFDLEVRDKAGSMLATSTYGLGATDFVAVDTNPGRRPAAVYTALVTQYTAGSFWVQQRAGSEIITLPRITHHGVTGPGDPDLAFSTLFDHDLASVADIYLSAGESFWASTTTAKGSLYLIGDTTLDPATYVVGRGLAGARQETQVLDGSTRSTATYTGWHALVQAGDRSPATHTPATGTAYALHRVDPASPDSCPQRNFPDPTP